MKKILILALGLLASGCASMQEVPDSEKTFSQVFEVPGHTAGQLYDNAKIWIAQNFRSAKEVIEHEDKESGIIIGNGNSSYPCSGLECVGQSDWRVHYTMRVETKDDKFRLTFSNLEISWPPSGGVAGNRVRMWQRGDFEKVKPVLLAFGDSIKTNLEKEQQSEQW